jgi:hypothetical protein
VDERLPDGAFVYFEIEGEPDFSQYSRELAAKQQREEGVPVVLVHVKGLAPPQQYRLIDGKTRPDWRHRSNSNRDDRNRSMLLFSDVRSKTAGRSHSSELSEKAG